MRPWFGPLMLGVLLASGCLGASDAGVPAATVPSEPSFAANATVTDATGGLEGVVVDDQNLPIGRVNVSILGTQASVETDPAGRYSFSGLDPTSVTVVFDARGFQGFAKKVDLLAGKVVTLNVVLRSIVASVPYPESFSRVAFVDAGTGNLHSQVLWKAGQGCSQCKIPLVFADDPWELRAEYVFTPTVDYPAHNEALYFSLYRNTTVDGPSPLTDEYLTSGWLEDHQNVSLARGAKGVTPGENHITLYVGGDHEPYVTYQQKLEVWLSIGHRGPLPAGWSAAPPKG